VRGKKAQSLYAIESHTCSGILEQYDIPPKWNYAAQDVDRERVVEALN
jgi:hypothetical protein